MKWQKCGGHFDLERLQVERDGLEQQTFANDFWDDNNKAKKILKEFEKLKTQIQNFKSLEMFSEDSLAMYELYSEDPDESVLEDVFDLIQKGQSQLMAMQMERMLSGELDGNNCYLTINAGAGGTESCDWAEMLMRMYLRYAEKKSFKTTMVDFTDGDGAGFRSVTLKIDGVNAYGFLKAEVGVHRLVRISPFDSNKRRHTSFASVFVYAEVDDDIDIEVREEDIKMDTYRAGGAGGQKVNKTDSAVRLTHTPTGVVVQCQNERSQHQNRAVAMQMLKARLYEKEIEKRNAEKDKVEANKEEIGWGSQIRSYVLHPYQMIKDHRTQFESAQTQSVLDGDLEEFIKEYLVNKG